MSAAATQAPIRTGVARRRAPRHPAALPVEVTALRSGIPNRIPGRAVNLCEGGLALALAGELGPGDSVGLELRLPDGGGPILLKAVVRHQALLLCGLEFLGLSEEQRTRIGYCAQSTSSVPGENRVIRAQPQVVETKPAELTTSGAGPIWPRRRTVSVRPLWIALAVFVAIGAVGWWHWYRAWNELESQIPRHDPGLRQPRAKVAAEVMEGLITYKTEPVYPEAAKQAKVQGMVVLDAVIGTDGAVVDLHPRSGPNELVSAAVNAVKWWRFQPYRVDGKAVEVETTVAVNFRDN